MGECLSPSTWSLSWPGEAQHEPRPILEEKLAYSGIWGQWERKENGCWSSSSPLSHHPPGAHTQHCALPEYPRGSEDVQRLGAEFSFSPLCDAPSPKYCPFQGTHCSGLVSAQEPSPREYRITESQNGRGWKGPLCVI